VIVLVLGGMRSGKSEVAEQIAAGLPAPVTYVATGTASDADMAARIEQHRVRRPSDWRTVEAGAELVARLRELHGTALVDSLGSWVAACDMAPPWDDLCAALRERDGDTVVVSEEVGLGVHPPTELGVRFADVLGSGNVAIARVADDVQLVVAGRVLRLP
jgi:adenosyl cobinamide kinase/adenosyl cobinamide phosphate guanylyltransferase